MRFLTLILIIVACSIAPGAVAAQTATPTNSTNAPATTDVVPETPETPIAPSYRETATPTPDTAPATTDAANATVDIGQVALLETGLDGETAYAVLRNDGSAAVDVTVYDAVISEGGKPAQTEQELQPGETVRVEVSTTQAGGGRRAIGILAGQSVYFDVLDGSSAWFRGSPTWTETRTAGLGGFAGGILVTMLIARRTLDSETEEVERYL